MKLGVFGGTFDPIHLGHLIVAEEARIRLQLEEVLFIPAGDPWLKSDRVITEVSHRLKMVELAVATNPNFRVSDLEVRRAGPSYIVDTLQELRQDLNDDTDLVIIVGVDALADIGRWRDPDRVFELATVVGLTRPGEYGHDLAPHDVEIIEAPAIGISSTDVRRRVAGGISIKHMVPEVVEEYIYEHGLYKGESG